MKMQHLLKNHEGLVKGQLVMDIDKAFEFDVFESVDVDIDPPGYRGILTLSEDKKRAVPFTEAIEAEKKRSEDAAKTKADLISKINATLDECDKDKDKNKQGLSYCVRQLLIMLMEGT